MGCKFNSEIPSKEIRNHYLRNPATVRKTMKRVKPDHTPARPNTGGAYSKTIEEIAPDTICSATS